MSLDLTKVAEQVGSMVARLKAGGEDRQERLQNALNVLQDKSLDLERLGKKIEASKTTWLVAGLVDGLSPHYKAPPLPPEFSVLATDGSNIDVDRHKSTRCYLINIGSVVLSYGAHPEALLDSFPSLYFGDDDLVIAPDGARGREQPIEGALLGIKRGVDECRELARLAVELPKESPALALLDGSLILWGLSGKVYPDFVIEALLNKGFLRHLEEMRKLNKDKRLALASYISFPRSTDVVNALRVAICPHEIIDTDRLCKECTSRDCDKVDGVRDRDVFSNILAPGERSALFTSQSSIVEKHYGGHWVYFFYIRVDDEIARVEIPQWAARDENLLKLTHALVLDQCRRGQGYPVALAEAHEQAVITGVDRESFWQLAESLMVEEHLPSLTSAKSFSKRTRWV
ncbi:MAG: DNA double-strand break repair nuclease NurA [Deltaproteobacteria bacterium]|nr:DNA double-strand break repair nuclease NurA [Deltaproteobacteria bacterium]